LIIKVNPDIYLTQISKEDKPHLIRHINDPDIYKNTLKIPYPYKENDADEWIAFVEKLKINEGVLKNWAIKSRSGELIGGIGFSGKYGLHSHKDEIGYWLGRSFWNKGIMTDVVQRVCDIGFTEFNLVRIEAYTFTYNIASKKVLIKTGFLHEGTLSKFHFKDGEFLDVDIFATLI